MATMTDRDTGDEQPWRPGDMPVREYGPLATLGVRTTRYLDEHRERLWREEFGVTPRMEFVRWLVASGRLDDGET